jgi:hypothetical protein
MRFVNEHSDRYAVALLLRVLDIESSTFYGWVKQASSRATGTWSTSAFVQHLRDLTTSGQTYGATGCTVNCGRGWYRVAP